MCTAISVNMREHYFGRNLDMEFSYKESVVVSPRRFPFYFRRAGELSTHLAFIGTAIIENGVPLYYDGTNEKGLSIAALRFREAHYGREMLGKDNIASFEFIPWVLCQCETVREVKSLLRHTALIDHDFNSEYPSQPLHWMISDSKQSVTVENTADGLEVYDNPVGVLTNSPCFPIQLFNLNNYMHLSNEAPENKLSEALELNEYSRGMGALGLPGDLSSMSRFVRAFFTKTKALKKNNEIKSVGQVFHILDSVCQQKGSVKISDKEYEYTVYTSCCNTDSGVYYFKTYYNSTVRAVDMHKEKLDSATLKAYPMKAEGGIRVIN